MWEISNIYNRVVYTLCQYETLPHNGTCDGTQWCQLFTTTTPDLHCMFWHKTHRYMIMGIDEYRT